MIEGIVLAPEQWLRVGGTVCHIVSIDDQGHVELEHFPSKERRFTSLEKLHELRPGIDISFFPKPNTNAELLDLIAGDDQTRARILKLPTEGKSFAELAETVVRMNWMQALKSNGYVDFRACDLWQPDIDALVRRHKLVPKSLDTLARWSALEKDSAGGLIPHFDRRGGKGQSRIDPSAADVLGNVIYEARDLTAKIRLTPTDIYNEVNARLRAKAAGASLPAQIVGPSLSTVTRALKSNVSPYDLAVAQFGKARADRMFEPSSRRPVIDFSGGASEFDDLDTKVFCIDERSGLGWGRPWLTQGADQTSSYPVGCSMDEKPRSAQSAVSSLVHSIGAKNMADYGAELAHLKWVAHGYPTLVLFDNALYNNHRIVTLNADVADTAWAQPFQPRQKRVIEYLNGQTVTDFLANEPGYRGALDDPEALAHGLKTALWGINLFRRRHLQWLIGVYSNRPMKDGLTPLQKYLEEGLVKFRCRIPPDVRRLRSLRLMHYPDKVLWGPNGIRTMGLTFQDVEQYRHFIKRSGGSMKVSAGIDPEDLTVLRVSIPDSDYSLAIPCLQQDYVAGLTLYQHRLVLKMCKQLKKSNPSLADMYKAREDLKKMTQQLIRSGQVRERRAGARLGDLPANPAAASTTEAVHDVEQEYRELGLVEMDQSDGGWAMPALE
jgi:putative transposase